MTPVVFTTCTVLNLPLLLDITLVLTLTLILTITLHLDLDLHPGMPGILGGLLSVLGVWLATPEVNHKSMRFIKNPATPKWPPILNHIIHFHFQEMVENHIYGLWLLGPING